MSELVQKFIESTKEAQMELMHTGLARRSKIEDSKDQIKVLTLFLLGEESTNRQSERSDPWLERDLAEDAYRKRY